MSMKLLKSTAVVGSMTLVSRISGLVRDVVVARMFGASGATDAFFIAFRIPNLLRRLFAEGAFAQAFVPVLSEYRSQREHAEVRHLVSCVCGTLGLVLLLITVLGILAAPLLVMVFAPGYLDDPERLNLTTEMLRFTFPYILFISLTALASGVLNSYGKFGLPAFTPVLLNLVLIAAALWLSPYFAEPIVALSVGVLLAGVAQLGFQLPALHRLRLLSWPRWNLRDAGVRRIGKLMLPAIIGSSAQQINLVFDSLISSFLAAGSITWLYYADRLVEFPLGVFGIALATVILPSLSAKFASADPERFNRTLDWAIRWAIVIGTPAMIGLIVMAGPLIASIFQYGKFSENDARMTQYALTMYSVGLLGYIYVKVLAPGYFSRQDTKTPVKYSIISIAIKMLLTVIIVPAMMLGDFFAPHVGLAFTTAFAAILNAALLYRGLRRDRIYQPLPGWLRLIIKVAVASAVMVAVLLLADLSNAAWLSRSLFARAGYLCWWVCAGVAAYFAALFVMRVDFKALLRHAD